MKILDYLNVSNVSNLEADSGFIFQRHLLQGVLTQRPDWEVYLISPKNPLPEQSRLHHIPMKYGRNKYEARFNFPWSLLKDKLSGILGNIDLIYINQSEQTANFKALAATMHPSREIPILTYIHYFPVDPPHIHFDDYPDESSRQSGGLDRSKLRFDETLNMQGLAKTVLLRQIEALQISRMGLTCSQFGIDLITRSIRKIIPDFSAPMTAIHPPVSLEEGEVGLRTPKSSENTIVFNHRMYNHYGPREFFDFLDWYRETRRDDFNVVLTDPTNNRSKERHQLDTSVNTNKEKILMKDFVSLNHSQDRENYYRTIGRARVAIAPFKPSALWSMSVVDCMAAGTPVIAPNYACFSEILGEESGLLVSSRVDLANKLDELFDNPDAYERARSYCISRASKFTSANTATKFIEVFEKIRRLR